jgi:hypothetical protein
VGPTDASNFAPWPVVSETPLTAESEPTPWHGAVLVLWSVGALAAGVRLAAGLARARRLVRRSTPVVQSRVTTMADDLARRLRIATPVAVRWSETAGTPMTSCASARRTARRSTGSTRESSPLRRAEGSLASRESRHHPEPAEDRRGGSPTRVRSSRSRMSSGASTRTCGGS